MATPDTFECNVITPEEKVLECQATFVAFPAHDGEMGVLRKRAPLVCKLGIGTLRIETPAPNSDLKGAGGAQSHVFFIDEGFAQVFENRLTILTEQARKVDDLDAKSAEAAMVEARAIKITDQASYTKRTKAIQRAQVQLKLAKPRT